MKQFTEKQLTFIGFSIPIIVGFVAWLLLALYRLFI